MYDARVKVKPKTLEDYFKFLKSKVRLASTIGFEVELSEINPLLDPHQKETVRWALRGGCRALFLKYGLGKTIIQLEILRLLIIKTGNRKLLIVPLGARAEFQHDAEMLRTGNEARVTDEQRAELQAWLKDRPERLLPAVQFVQKSAEVEKSENQIFITNYESVREGKIDPELFDTVSLDEADVLRGFGGTKTFREFMAMFAGDRKTMNERTFTKGVKYRFVATATPDPNEFIELLAYAAFLGIMDVSAAKTRFFKRNSEKADNLTLHPHKEEEFWLWVSSWALFLQRPSDLGFSDDKYILPELEVVYHEVAVDHKNARPDKHGQGRLYQEVAGGVADASKEKRLSLNDRVAKMVELLGANPDDHAIIWHDLEDERRAIENEVPGCVSVFGTQKIETREQIVVDFRNGKLKYLAGKPQMLGAGVNMQYHCHWAIFLGIGFKFRDFIQAIHRLYRFLQTHKVRIDIIYAESERNVLATLKEKWERHDYQNAKMSEIIKKYGLSTNAMHSDMIRGMGVEREEINGPNFRYIHNDSIIEARRMADNSVGLVLSSIPFATQYEYSPNFADLGHTDNNEHFFEQMDFLTPELFRTLQPGRLAIIHVKDRIVPGGMTGLGFGTVYRFADKVCDHFEKHGFGFVGRKTIVTDVVRENNQTYRLGWSEQCKDGTKMGVGMPEYLLYFRKPQTESGRSYADVPVVKDKDDYSRSRWQIDAHGFMRSSGNRLMSGEEIDHLPHDTIYQLYKQYSRENVYDFEQHVALSESLETCTTCRHIHTGPKGVCNCVVRVADESVEGGYREEHCTGSGRLPTTFMLLQPQSWHADVWTDVTRMRTLNSTQVQKGKQMHLCPLQFDIADRVINQLSNPGDIVFDPFAGIGTVPVRAIKAGRIGVGVELSHGYFVDGAAYCEAEEQKIGIPTLFDLEPLEGEELGVAA